jgi:hypothetical protein
MKKSIIQIIKETIQDFYNDWSPNDEPSLADKYFKNKTGIETKPQQQKPINAQLIGYVTKRYNEPIPAVPVYKNPKNLQGFLNNTRGIILANSDFYIATSPEALHDDMLTLLTEHGIIPYGSKFDYGDKLPEEFVAVQRAGNTNIFGASDAYFIFPNYYITIFDNANQKQPFEFNYDDFDTEGNYNTFGTYNY